MSYTNKTTHYELPQYVSGDIPAWLSDFNDAMQTIDSAIYDVASAEATSEQNVTALGTRVTSAENSVSATQTALGQVQTAVAENTADIATAEGNINGLGTRMTSAENGITAIGGQLTANQKPFQFAYDSTNQVYGYTVDGTFHPFEDSADFQEELYEALQYSGLVQEGDTVEEMLQALAEYFPELFYVFNEGNQMTERTGGWLPTTGSAGGAIVESTHLFFALSGASGGYSISTNNAVTIPNDATKLYFELTDGAGGSASTIAWVGLANAGGISYNDALVKAEAVGLANGTYEVDISSYADTSKYILAGMQVNTSSTCSFKITNIYFK